jgi:hypothetical protein
MTYDIHNETRDMRTDCMKTMRKEHDWVFDDATGIGKCSRCPATIDTGARVK